jgi:hypothetical protein
MKTWNLLFLYPSYFDQSMCRPKAKTMTILRRAIEEYELISAAGMPDDYTQVEYDIKTTEPVVYAASTNTTLKCRNTTTA